MGLQSSGQISLEDIRAELSASTTNVSLRSMSNSAGKSSPDAISEFYGYSAISYYSFNSSLKATSPFGVCFLSIGSTWYYDDAISTSFPVVGQVCYTNPSGNTKLPSGFYRVGLSLFIYISGSNGAITSTSLCGGCLLEGTLVTLADGTQTAIENLLVGDNLESLNINTVPNTSADCDGCVDELLDWNTSNFTSAEGLAAVITNDSLEVNEIININNGLLKSTIDHIHFIKRNDLWQFKRAGEILQGDILLNNKNKEVLIVSAELMIGNVYTVYRLNVETNDVFYANGILTHNAK